MGASVYFFKDKFLISILFDPFKYNIIFLLWQWFGVIILSLHNDIRDPTRKGSTGEILIKVDAINTDGQWYLHSFKS
jgi:hypothetical protein